MRLFAKFVSVTVFIMGCSSETEKINDEVVPDHLQGKFISDDSTVDHFKLWGCFCNVVGSGIRVTNTSGSGLGGQELVTWIAERVTGFTFSTWTCVGPSPQYVVEKQMLTLDSSTFELGDSLAGKMSVRGSFNENNKKKFFEITGHFKCKLQDSAYDYDALINDMLRHYDSLNKLKRRSVARNHPDSLIECKED